MVEYKYPEAKVKKVEETQKLNINSLSDLMKELEARSNKLKETPLPQDELSQLLGLKLNDLIIITSRLNLVNDLVDHVKGTKSKFDRIEEIKKMDKESRKKYLDEYLKLVLETKGINKETVFNVYSKLEGRKTELENTLNLLMDSGREFLPIYDKLYDLAVQYNENLVKLQDLEKLIKAGKSTKKHTDELNKIKEQNAQLETPIKEYKEDLIKMSQINKDLERNLNTIKSDLDDLKKKYRNQMSQEMTADIDAIIKRTGPSKISIPTYQFNKLDDLKGQLFYNNTPQPSTFYLASFSPSFVAEIKGKNGTCISFQINKKEFKFRIRVDEYTGTIKFTPEK